MRATIGLVPTSHLPWWCYIENERTIWEWNGLIETPTSRGIIARKGLKFLATFWLKDPPVSCFAFLANWSLFQVLSLECKWVHVIFVELRAALREDDKGVFDDLLSHITRSSLTQQSADVTSSNFSKTDIMSAAAMSATTPSNDRNNTLSESDMQDLSYGANNKDIKMSCQQKSRNIPSACLQVIFLLLNIDMYSFSLTCMWLCLTVFESTVRKGHGSGYTTTLCGMRRHLDSCTLSYPLPCAETPKTPAQSISGNYTL